MTYVNTLIYAFKKKKTWHVRCTRVRNTYAGEVENVYNALKLGIPTH